MERVDDERRCAANNKIALDHLIQTPGISTVILAARFVSYADSQPLGLDSSNPVRLVALDGKLRDSQETLVTEAITNTINTLTAAGKKVVVMGEVPQQIFDESRCHARKAMWPTLENDLDCDVPSDINQKRSNKVNNTLTHVSASSNNICIFHPEQYLCNSSKCISDVDGYSIYQDNNHLNERGSTFISQFFSFSRCLPSH